MAAVAISKRACALLLLLLPAMAVLLHGQAARLSAADFPLGGQATVRLPRAPYQPRFAATAVVLDDARGSRRPPGFVAAVSAEADGAGAYTCSLALFLGGVKVWASDHLEKFAARALCRLELTEDGQLQLTDGAGMVGWLSGTAGQGVKALHLDAKTGNLVLVDAQNRTRWQSLDDPTDKFLRGQHRRLPAYFIASMTDETSSPFYSLELDDDKIAAYIHVGDTSYSYWELAPTTANRTMTSARLDGSGLKMLDARGMVAAQVSPPVKKPPLSFMALGGDGNLEMYYYDAQHRGFRVSYRTLGFCELPLSCGVQEVCSAAGKCEDFSAYADGPARAGRNPCYGTGGEACMIHLRGVTTVLLTAATALAGVTLRQCVVQCASNSSCSAALYVKDNASVAAATDHGVCEHYTLVVGAREVPDVSSRRYSYWVKFPAAGGGDGDVDDDGDSSPGMLGKILIVCGAIDVACAVVFTILVTLYFRRLCRLAAAVDRIVELQQGEGEGAGEQNSFDSNGADG